MEYIEREKALSAQNKSMNLSECRKRLERIPAADVRPVLRGQNIYGTVDGHCEFKCSVCGVELSSVYGGRNDFGLDGGYFNFCPNCGARMEER